MKIVIVDYGVGNLYSVEKALRKAGYNQVNLVVSNDLIHINDASHIVLPGVGAFPECMHNLKQYDGLISCLYDNVVVKQKPFLGICVGMQLLAKYGHEHQLTEGLGWLDAEVILIDDQDVKVPHIGWNSLNIRHPHGILEHTRNKEDYYFVHSYYMACNNSKDIIACADYGNVNMPAIIAKDNIIGIQFHPEKSHTTGLQILTNFLSM